MSVAATTTKVVMMTAAKWSGCRAWEPERIGGLRVGGEEYCR